MLEPIRSGVPADVKFADFAHIDPNIQNSGVCYVRGGQHRFTRMDKPFIVLYLVDTNGVVIPGYIFDVSDFQKSGLELTQVIHSVVDVKYQDNYHPKYGVSVILDKVAIVNNPAMDVLDKFVGSSKQTVELYHQLQESLSTVLGMKVSLPYVVCTMSHMDYNQGEIGGLVIHYWNMLKILEVYSNSFSEKEKRQLWGTFLVYLYTHSNYLKADEQGEADISLVTQLTSTIERLAPKLGSGNGMLEVVHIFFGYEPKDIFVRLVLQVSKELVRASKEISLYKTLPLTREGNAGYGTIRKYQE